MKHPRLITSFRISWSAVWLVACLFLIVLWMRSYWRTDLLAFGNSRAILIGQGRIQTAAVNFGQPVSTPTILTFRDAVRLDMPEHSFLGFGFESRPVVPNVVVPYWIPVVVSAVLTALPWIRWRFSLRTLLIAISLVALVLGLIVWLR